MSVDSVGLDWMDSDKRGQPVLAEYRCIHQKTSLHMDADVAVDLLDVSVGELFLNTLTNFRR